MKTLTKISKLIRLIESTKNVQSQDLHNKCLDSQVMKQYDGRQKNARVCVKQILVSLNDKVFKLNQFTYYFWFCRNAQFVLLRKSIK